MNNSSTHVHCVLWNAALGLWQDALETARYGVETQSELRTTPRLKESAAPVINAQASFVRLSIPSLTFAQLPTSGQVVGGQISIPEVNLKNRNTLNINQTTECAALDWQTFKVGQGNTVDHALTYLPIQ